MANITTRNVYDVQFSNGDLNALQCAECAIEEIVNAFGSEGALMSAESGECVELSELNRVRTILNFLYNHRIFNRI